MEYGLGCRGPKRDARDFQISFKKAGVINLPTSYELKNLPRVKNQGQINSCCAHAASSILEYYANGAKLSTEFLYGMERSVCGESEPGMYLIDACKIAQSYGDMLETDLPGNHEVPSASDLAEIAAKDTKKMECAKNFCIKSYYACQNSNDIKYAIMTYGPVLVCMYWYGEYSLDKDGVISFENGKSITNEGGVSDDGGYHAVMVYGWNETGWLVQNSWGPAFANKGRFILPYKYEIAEARVMIDDENANTAGLIRTDIKEGFFSKLKRKLFNK